jgi:hypothetical protein
MASSQIEISLVGSSIAVKRLKGNKGTFVGNEPIDYFPVSSIRGITSTGLDNRQLNAGGNASSYEYLDQLAIHLEFFDVDAARLTFDIQSVTNQASWTKDSAGLLIALSDINSWVGAISGSTPVTPVPGSAVLTTDDSLGGNGTDFIDSLAAVTGAAYKYLIINDDAVFSILIDSAVIDMLTSQNYTAKTVGKGMLIRANNGELITDVTVTSGSATGIK